jgi:hypothetical protein
MIGREILRLFFENGDDQAGDIFVDIGNFQNGSGQMPDRSGEISALKSVNVTE